MKTAVFGSTGNTGSIVVRRLAELGTSVKAITRKSDSGLSGEHIEAHVWDWEAEGAFDAALEGCDSAYFMIPTGMLDGDLTKFRDEYSRRFYAAANTAGLKRVVHLSSFGAHQAENSGVLKGLFLAEQHAAEFTGSLLIIRPGYFWQNFRSNVQPLATRDFFGGYPVSADVPLLFADVADIGTTAAEELVAENGRVGTWYLGHPEIRKISDVALELGAAIDKPDLSWTNVGYEGASKFMSGNGMPENLVSNFIEFFECINSGRAMDDFSGDRLIAVPKGTTELVQWFSQAYREV